MFDGVLTGSALLSGNIPLRCGICDILPLLGFVLFGDKLVAAVLKLRLKYGMINTLTVRDADFRRSNEEMAP